MLSPLFLLVVNQHSLTFFPWSLEECPCGGGRVVPYSVEGCKWRSWGRSSLLSFRSIGLLPLLLPLVFNGGNAGRSTKGSGSNSSSGLEVKQMQWFIHLCPMLLPPPPFLHLVAQHIGSQNWDISPWFHNVLDRIFFYITVECCLHLYLSYTSATTHVIVSCIYIFRSELRNMWSTSNMHLVLMFFSKNLLEPF